MFDVVFISFCDINKSQIYFGISGGSGGNKKLAEALQSSATQVDSLTPQLVSAGSIRLNYPQSKAAEEHFENLKQQYSNLLVRTRNLCDEATDSGDFIKSSGWYYHYYYHEFIYLFL